MTVTTILVVVIIIATIALIIALDVLTIGKFHRLGALRQWQTLIGTMLGFATAAGILALSASIERETARDQHLEALATVGQALAIEAQALDAVLARAQGLERLVRTSETDGETVAECPGLLRELAISLERDTPIYAAAVPHFVEVGEPNLGLFVAFYGAYGEITRDVTQYVGMNCPVVLPETEQAVVQRLAEARAAYATLAARYVAPR